MPKEKITIKRGKTSADLPPAQQQQGLVAGSRDEVAHGAGRPTRIPMANAKKLDFPEHLKEEGFYYRWFKDRNGRITQATAAAYVPVVDEQGNQFTRASGEDTMYLMKLPIEYRNEDNLLKRDRVAATLGSEDQIAPGEYAPDQRTGRAEGGNSAISRGIETNPYS